MADPVSAGIAAAGSIVKGVAGYQAGRKNKKALFGQALEEERAGVAEEARIRDAARQAMGEQVSAQFSNGFFGGTGSALDALQQSQINAALDTLNIRREAAGKARSLRAQGRQAATQGKFALVEGLLGAGSSIAGMSSDWASAKSGTTTVNKPKGPY